MWYGILQGFVYIIRIQDKKNFFPINPVFQRRRLQNINPRYFFIQTRLSCNQTNIFKRLQFHKFITIYIQKNTSITSIYSNYNQKKYAVQFFCHNTSSKRMFFIKKATFGYSKPPWYLFHISGGLLWVFTDSYKLKLDLTYIYLN